MRNLTPYPTAFILGAGARRLHLLEADNPYDPAAEAHDFAEWMNGYLGREHSPRDLWKRDAA